MCLEVAWLILTLRASYRKVKDQVQVAGPTPLPLYPSTPALSPSTSHWPAWFGHAPGIEQFGEALFREDFLLFGHLTHGLA